MHENRQLNPAGNSSRRDAAELFAVSALVLFLELACIRWLPAHVLFLTFFTNTVLLASFLGMSLGCLVAKQQRNYLAWTPLALTFMMLAALTISFWRSQYAHMIDVGNQMTPQLVFFGTEYHAWDVRQFIIPIEAVCGVFFLLVALAMLGPGQQLGRCLERIPNRLRAYTLNIAGSIAGIVLFAGCAKLELPPVWWFAGVSAGVGYFVWRTTRVRRIAYGMAALLVGVVLLASLTSGRIASNRVYWSPYYRIDYVPEAHLISVNLIGHQQMISRDAATPITNAPAYALPYLFRRDSGGAPFQDVLVIGAGSGNDVSRALQWGARHVDAVEIDPAIQRLGLADHPDGPYRDPRVTRVLDDGRSFLRSTPRQYDLIVYALIDSMALHSSYSNIRLESYLFTTEALRDVRSRLKPGGVFVMYNYFRQGWIVSRLQQSLAQVFQAEPLVLAMPYQREIDPRTTAGFMAFFAGDTRAMSAAFERHPYYWLPRSAAVGPASSDGFALDRSGDEDEYLRFGLTRIRKENLRLASDEWPFLYLHHPMVPALSLRGMAVMGGLSVVLVCALLPRRGKGGAGWSFNPRMFFLGAGFMLIETRAVVQMALLFGSTWMVNTIVFFAILVTILLANLMVGVARPRRLWPLYAGLMVCLALNVSIPLERFLALGAATRMMASCALVFAPILFAAVIFAVSFAGSAQPDLDFGWNIAGAMLGGLMENTSMLLGFRYLVVVAAVFYVASALRARATRGEPAETPAFSSVAAGAS
ncbi:MAG: hypothetical protein ACR2IF_08520 [Terriglobales bacterium]